MSEQGGCESDRVYLCESEYECASEGVCILERDYVQGKETKNSWVWTKHINDQNEDDTRGGESACNDNGDVKPYLLYPKPFDSNVRFACTGTDDVANDDGDVRNDEAAVKKCG